MKELRWDSQYSILKWFFIEKTEEEYNPKSFPISHVNLMIFLFLFHGFAKLQLPTSSDHRL